jgi:chorismate-pyruvate lyase
MLLAGDGSTTLLLEALLDTRLTAHVERQERFPAGQLSSAAVSALGLTARGAAARRCGGAAVRRISVLRTPAGAVVSRNTVVFTTVPVGWSGSTGDPAPLGRRLREGRTRQHREILASGTAQWREDGHACPCAYKEYVITCDDGVRLYVHERFSPDRVRPMPVAERSGPLPRTG